MQNTELQLKDEISELLSSHFCYDLTQFSYRYKYEKDPQIKPTLVADWYRSNNLRYFIQRTHDKSGNLLNFFISDAQVNTGEVISGTDYIIFQGIVRDIYELKAVFALCGITEKALTEQKDF